MFNKLEAGGRRDKIASIIEGGPLRLNFLVAIVIYGSAEAIRKALSIGVLGKGQLIWPLDKCGRQRNGTRAYSVGKSQLCFLYPHFPTHHNKQ